MHHTIDELVKSSDIFSSLDEESRKLLLSKFTRIALELGETLFNQGDKSDSVYLLVKGKLSAQLTKESGTQHIIGYIHPGETVGELGAFTNEQRTFTIKALQESVLLKLSAKDFIQICQQHPKVIFAVLRPMMARTSSLIQLLSTEKRSNKHIVIAPANNSISLEKLASIMQEFSEKYSSLLILSDYQSDFSNKQMETKLVKEKILHLAKQKKSTYKILYILSSFDTPLAKIAFKRANSLYVAAHNDSKPQLDNRLLEKIRSKQLHLLTGPIFLLLHDNKYKPKNTSQWLSLTTFTMNLHVRLDNNKDLSRLFRFIRGRAVGLVLSGGGTRGWAHIGAIKALREAKIPIDIIGGTSVGALVAGCYAMHQSYKLTFDLFNQIVIDSAHSISWRSLTWPIISLFNAKNYTNSQKKAFGHLQIENLLMPYFCITSNLASNNEDVHTTGLLWKKIRASTAIPGIIPPVLINDELHIDGGLINNLPVDIMRQFIGRQGRIIAVELNTFSPDDKKYHFPPVITFWNALLIKLKLKRNPYKFPKFIDTFMHGLFVGSLFKSKLNAALANTFVSLKLNEFSMLHSNPEEGERLVQLGYEETLKQLGKTNYTSKP